MSQHKPHQIARLPEILKKWRRRALQKAHSFSDRSACTGNNAGSMHTKRSISLPSIREGGCSSGGGSTTGKVLAGHIPVDVGEERRRFLIKTSYLSHPLFYALLLKTEEEIGFQKEGVLALACEVAAFKRLLHVIESTSKAAHRRHKSMGEDACAAKEEECEGLLQELLESEDVAQYALSTVGAAKQSHSLCNLSHTLSQTVVV